MEALSMLKYWRGSGGGGGGYGDGVVDVKAAAVEVVEEDEEEEEENDDEGPFFDLEFAVPDGEEVVVEEETDGEEKEDEVFGFAVPSGGSSNGDVDVGEGDVSISLSPSEDLFFKGRLVPLEQDGFSDAVEAGNSKPAGGQFPAVSLLKSATKFRVFLLGRKKPRHATTSTVGKASEQSTSSPTVAKTPPMGTPGHQGKLFTVKFKVEEVPIISLFTRDNSSKGSFKSSKPGAGGKPSSADIDGASDAKRLVNRYLKMIKPLYVRVSRRHAEKLKLETAAEPPPPPSSTTTAVSSPAVSASIAGMIKSSTNVNLPAGLRVVCKHLGKSRSASSAAVLPAVTDGQASSKRRDDSLMQQQDSIQSAILHCKRSFNASSDGAANQAVPAARCGGATTINQYLVGN